MTRDYMEYNFNNINGYAPDAYKNAKAVAFKFQDNSFNRFISIDFLLKLLQEKLENERSASMKGLEEIAYQLRQDIDRIEYILEIFDGILKGNFEGYIDW